MRSSCRPVTDHFFIRPRHRNALRCRRVAGRRVLCGAMIILACAATTVMPRCAVSPVAAQEIQLAQDAPGPLTPEESQKLFRVPRGLRVELVASEPFVADPVAMAFDARGRILVCELHGYNLEGYLDVLELNKTGELDRQVRRIPATEEAIQRAAQEQYGTVKRLEDTDGDGRVDHVSVLADRLPPCYGVIPARDGVIAFCAPDIVYLRDADDDGQAEQREVLFTGFGVGELWTRINNPRWGIDNWIYGVSGMNSGGEIRGPHLPQPVTVSSVCFRFRADGTVFEPASGWTHGYGQAIDQWGDRFLCTNQQHALHVIPIAHEYLMRNPYFAAPDLVLNISDYGHPARVYPTSVPDPWRRQRAADPAWVKFYGAAEATANGYFTAASGQTIYYGDGLPHEYYGNHFSVDNAQNMVHRCLLEPRGVTYGAHRPDPDEQCEFLTSTEQWFRPVNLLTGPDGMLYIVDMYRDIIEDYSAIPRYLQQLYINSLIAGADRGRIWRVVPNDAHTDWRVDLASRTSAELVTYVAHPNVWWQETAQRLLVERQDKSVGAPLRRFVAQREVPGGRVRALYVLEGLDLLTSADVVTALGDASPLVRVHALRLAERWAGDLSVQPAMLRLEQDAEPRVRLQLALSLGQCDAPQAVAALSRMATGDGVDQWLRAAVISSSLATADRLVAQLLGGKTGESAESLAHALCSVIGARRDGQQLASLLETLSRQDADAACELQVACLSGLLEGLQRGSAPAAPVTGSVRAVQQLLHCEHDEVRRLAVRTAFQLGINELDEMHALFAAARDQVADESAPLDERRKAVDLLAAAPSALLQDVAHLVMTPQQPAELQLALARAAGQADDAPTLQFLLEGFASYTPQLQSAVLDVVFARQARLALLLDAVEGGAVPANMVDAARRERLLTNHDQTIAHRAEEILQHVRLGTGRQAVLERYRQSLQLPRDRGRGQAVFEKQCSKCHRLGDQGYAVGPDLLTVKTRADETLISDILDPSNQIALGYNTYNVVTMNGRIFSGVLASETATSIALRAEEGKESVILRQEIDELATSTISMMPENLEQEVSPQDVADLLGFLRQMLGSATPPEYVLFDDDVQFPRLLNEGDGTARLVSGDRYRGAAALAVRPPQKYSAAIPGWQFHIAEHPGPGEYRYLRFAWKQEHGDGVMLELAADGVWPAADSPRQRYFSGHNGTPWQATCVSSERPGQWTVVTRDLWADVGAFTLTGLAPTAMGGEALFDDIRLLRTLEDATPQENAPAADGGHP